MANKRSTFSGLFIIFIWSIFMGVTAISIGVGALFPGMNVIAQPFVCPNGQMQNTSQYYQISPSTSETTISWYCVDGKTGTQTELGIFPMSLYSGAIYGLLLFALIMIVRYFIQKRSASTTPVSQSAVHYQQPSTYLSQQSTQFASSAASDRHARQEAAQRAELATEARVRLEKLKELHTSNLISDEEYQQKRAEILRDM